MVRRQISCQNCKNLFWTPTKKMHVVWRVRIQRDTKVGTFDTELEARKIDVGIDKLPEDAREEIKKLIDEVMVDGKIKYDVWIVKLVKVGVPCGSYENHLDAEQAVIPNLLPDQLKLIEKIYTIKQNFCGSCVKLALSINKRAKADAKRRAMAENQGKKVKGNIIKEIKEEDAKGFMKFLIDKRVQQEQNQRQKEELEKQKANNEQKK